MEFGVYVHIPFCAHRCDYCDFATWTDRGHLVERYVQACVADVRRRYADGAHPPATSVFFGGGTPSLAPAELLVAILDEIPLADGAEVTVECNPDSVDPRKLDVYRRHGVTRVSLGVQSMVDHVLASLGRTHDPANVERAVGWIRAAGFETFNVDVIHGAAGESVDDWRRTLDRVVELDPPHVSAYALTVEPGTPLARRIDAGRVAPPDDDDQAAKYEMADDRLTGAGIEWYEVSNWARPGHECRHNLLYWRGGDWLAVGCAGHGAVGGRRWWNVRTPERYVARIEAGEPPEAGSEALSGTERERELQMLALRTRDGAVLPGPPDPAMAETLRELEAAGLLERRGDRVVLTRPGRLLASELTLRLGLVGPASHRGGPEAELQVQPAPR